MPGVAINFGPIDRHIADQLRARRERFGMPFNVLERQLAECGRPIPALGLRRIERYERRIDADDLVALAACLELDPVEIFARAIAEAGDTLTSAGVKLAGPIASVVSSPARAPHDPDGSRRGRPAPAP